MTLEHLINSLCELAIHYNLVNWAGSGPSIYELNSETINDYPVLFISPTDDITVSKSTTTFRLTFYYVDRLLSDSMNETQIFSVATTTLINFIRQIKSLGGVVSVGDFNIRLFTNTEKMSDRCAGGYARVTITVVNTANCAQWFDETGAPIGTYIPSIIQDVSVLESFASKPWVKQYVADNAGGVDEKEVKKLIKESLKYYTKTNKFATINGSGITNEEAYDLLERDYFNEFVSGYSQEVLDIYAAISAATPEDYAELRTQVSANTENIRTLSGATENIGSGLSELSGVTAQVGDDLQSLSGTVVGNVEKIADVSGATEQNVSDIEALSGTTTALSQQVLEQYHAIETLSGQSSSITQEIAVLSGFTEQAVSSLTSQVETLSGATSDALAGVYSGMSGMEDDIEALSGSAVSMEAKISALTANDNVVIFDLRKYGTGSTVTNGIYQAMVSAHTAGKHIFLVANVALTEHNSHLYVLPSTAPAEIFYDDNDDIYFRFCFVTDLPGVPDGIYVSKAAEFRKNYSSGLIHNVEEEFYVVDLDWRILRQATPTEFGAVKLGSGMTQTTYGVANVAIGSGLTFDAEGNVTNPYTGNVESQSVTKIWSGSLQAYQDLGTYSNDTLYLII